MLDLNPSWRERLALLRHDFQPIARTADGSAYGFEALLRGSDLAGFPSIQALFDAACADRVLYALDVELRAKAFAAFAAEAPEGAKLFYNLDNRLLDMPDYATGNSLRIAEACGLKPSRVVFEVSELHEPGTKGDFDRILGSYRDQGFKIALDDFGAGYAGLKLLRRSEPDIVKIDRHFVAGAGEDPRGAAFLEKIVGMARLMGITVVAEGVETPRELSLCAGAGCDLVQGYLVARPGAPECMEESYPAARPGGGPERRAALPGGIVGLGDLEPVLPVGIEVEIGKVLERFRRDPEATLVPVVDESGEPVGVYRERDFRQYVYSPYGISLLAHLTAELGPGALLVKAPVMPLGSDLARLVEVYGANPECGGVILAAGRRYAGLVPADRILALVAERELAEARDQNPLTRLPGNLRIAETCAELLGSGEEALFAYFDFDSFKPFNDRYGFRNGDRVIMLFADILRAEALPGGFVGHLGGDDFFAAYSGPASAEALAALRRAAARFAQEASSFYEAEDRDRGWILGKDREGLERRIPLITVSLAAIRLGPGTPMDQEELAERFARLKKDAKASPLGFALDWLEGSGAGPSEGPATAASAVGPAREGARRGRAAGSRSAPILPRLHGALALR